MKKIFDEDTIASYLEFVGREGEDYEEIGD